jgi:hypothetical protein
MTLTRRRACLGAISTALGRRANMVFLSGGSAVQNSGGLMRPAVQPVAADLFIQAHGDSFTFDMGDFNNYLFVLKASILASKGLNARVARRGINGISYNYRWPSQPYNATLISDAATGVDVSRVPGIDNWVACPRGYKWHECGFGWKFSRRGIRKFQDVYRSRDRRGLGCESDRSRNLRSALNHYGSGARRVQHKSRRG